VPERGADRTPGGVDAGDHRQYRHAQDDHVVDRSSIHLGVEQVGQQIVAIGVAALVDPIPKVIADAEHPALNPFGVIRELQGIANPAGECVGKLLRDSEDRADDADGNLLGIIGRGVCPACVEVTVDQ
jgi:hypothetical protein